MGLGFKQVRVRVRGYPHPHPTPTKRSVSRKLGRVQMAAESAACVLGMVLMPAIVSAAAGCPAGTPRPSGAPLDGEARDCRSDAQAQLAHDMQAHLASECWG